jgi:hypothetical protein
LVDDDDDYGDLNSRGLQLVTRNIECFYIDLWMQFALAIGNSGGQIKPAVDKEVSVKPR